MKILGHRGCLGEGYPLENSLSAIRFCMDAGAQGVELDVHLSKDQRLVVHHDASIKRISGEDLLIQSNDLETLRAYFQEAADLPTLQEVIGLLKWYIGNVPDMLINIELKAGGCEAAICQRIAEYVLSEEWHYYNFIISSFHNEFLQSVYSINPKIPIGLLCDQHNSIRPSKLVEKLGFTPMAIHPHFSLLTKEWVDEVRALSIKLVSWGGDNHPSMLEQATEMGLDALITDYPEKCLTKKQYLL